MNTFDAQRQRVIAQAARIGLAVRRRNKHPYGWELFDRSEYVHASGDLDELMTWLADNAIHRESR
ncbi:hypothetical protein [Nocardia sp. NPDC049149]|uniref:hypothetical protein n=1 Tax=Nocardia sp. NPDC049149 TaxID=3364315 RepID=UPI003723FB88